MSINPHALTAPSSWLRKYILPHHVAIISQSGWLNLFYFAVAKFFPLPLIGALLKTTVLPIVLATTECNKIKEVYDSDLFEKSQYITELARFFMDEEDYTILMQKDTKG